MAPNHIDGSSPYTKIGDRLRVMERFDPSKLTKVRLLLLKLQLHVNCVFFIVFLGFGHVYASFDLLFQEHN